ncbi:MAG: DUF4205 domain-containing protein [Clostridiales bacterium]|nr:DUF4205 domain-containing protein [Clostridiales bacterium]
MERKFAVIRVVGNDEEVLKVFDDDKQAALAYGAEIAKNNTDGVIACVQAFFNEENKMCTSQFRVFEVWEPDDTEDDVNQLSQQKRANAR